MRIGLVVPHIFMQENILPHVIFSPGNLALQLADGLAKNGADVTLFTPGPVATIATNITADLSYFETELAGRGDTYLELLKKHPFTFITLARQVQSELIAKAYAMANADKLDVVHIYTNEEDTALPFADFCTKPVVFTHHDPFNFLVKYKSIFPKYPQLNWISMSYAQRIAMPESTNWVANIYHGLAADTYLPQPKHSGGYLAYMGRIIESKGVHLAIAAVKHYNTLHPDRPYTLKLAGKHYAGQSKDTYWQRKILPELDDHIQYEGFLSSVQAKQTFLAHADALVIPSTFAEPFGMVMIEALACGTPVIGLDSGAIPEVILDGQTGYVVRKGNTDEATVYSLATALASVHTLNRALCRSDFEQRFTLDRMCREHLAAYQRLIDSPKTP